MSPFQLECENSACLCHWLCPSGHYLSKGARNMTGCTYFPTLERHRPLKEGEIFELCLCNKVCCGARSGGYGSFKVSGSKPRLLTILK